MKKNNLYKSVLSTFLISGVVFAEPEVTGKITLESAAYTHDGPNIGSNLGRGNDLFKNQISGRVYIDGGLEDDAGSTYHVELQGFNDSKAVSSHDGNDSYTQRDALREAYVDTGLNDWLIRAGKQQVVWGTADGMKLLDAINPTDYSEIAQNQMEDSRIPVWMINADKTDENGGNWQFIVSESRSSHLAGMGNSSSTAASRHYSISDSAHPFIMKGVDTISGRTNGIVNVTGAMGDVANAFDAAGNALGYGYGALAGFGGASLDDFVRDQAAAAAFGGICSDSSVTNATCLYTITNTAAAEAGQPVGANNQFQQNLFSDTTEAQWNAGKANPTQTFHYMPHATFATFGQFVGMKSKYTVDHDSTPTLAARYKNTTPGGTNYSFNLIRGNDTNPYIDTYWTRSDTGATLTEGKSASGTKITNLLSGGSVVGNATGKYAIFNMVEKLNKITQVGGSMDTAIETESLGPVVLRAEALYQKDVMSPVITRKDSSGIDLEHGFLVSSLKMEKGDRFKYVLGADITALTNMMISLQFIQDRNLDYVDNGSSGSTNWKYTADMATMHLTNNFQKAEKNKDFYSLFFSKPFGESGQHRWNNITIYEENGGKWNRFDVEYTLDDNTIATAELNNYWGNENTQFGQFKNSSNVQVGLKYTF